MSHSAFQRMTGMRSSISFPHRGKKILLRMLKNGRRTTSVRRKRPLPKCVCQPAPAHIAGEDLLFLRGGVPAVKPDIKVAGFQTTDRRDFFDLCVGNVPFGDYKVNDKPYNKLGFSIHNYFFASTISGWSTK